MNGVKQFIGQTCAPLMGKMDVIFVGQTLARPLHDGVFSTHRLASVPKETVGATGGITLGGNHGGSHTHGMDCTAPFFPTVANPHEENVGTGITVFHMINHVDHAVRVNMVIFLLRTHGINAKFQNNQIIGYRQRHLTA
ncbi:MAG TPA: hypothetical protein DDY12_05525 [Porphyromonadaceae bacterium]|nr:hypothetical protein [Porphyromonadaceae bacterium]